MKARWRAGVMWLIPAALLLVAVLLVFGQCAAFGWTNWDDHLHVTDNPKLNPVTLAHLVEFWREPYGGLYIPVSYTLFGIEAWIGRSLFWVGNASAPPAAVFHVTSIALHGACVLLVWRLLTTLVGRPWPAAAGAMLFAVHPLQVESVAWISEQRGLLSALFSLVALLCHLQARRSGEAFWHRGSWQAFAAFVAAILSKPSAMTLPLAAGAIDLLLLRRPWRRVAAELAPWCAVSAIAAIGTKLLQPDTIVLDLPPLGLRPIIAGDAIGFYVSKLLMPLQLGIDYGRTPESLLHDSLPWVGALSIAAAIALLFLLPALRSCRLPAVLFLAPLLPVLGFVPFAFQHISTVADRYTYLAMLGPALGISLVLASPRLSVPLARIAKAAIVGVLVSLAFLSFRQAQVWRNCETLYAQAMRINPASHHAYNNAGTALLDAQEPKLAVEPLTAAVTLKPNFAKAHYNLATALHQLGESSTAVEHYEAALRLDPRHADAHNNLGILLAQQGEFRLAIENFLAAIAIRDDFSDARRNLENARKLSGSVTNPAPTP